MAAPPMAESSLPEKPSLDFGFAFDDANFSDRIIRIEILPDLSGSEPELDDSLSRRRCTRSQKRRRVDSVSNANGDGVAKDNGQSSSTEYSGFRVKNLHVSSPVLAANSPFFYKLFSNGIRESHQRHVTLHIQASDKFEVASCMRYCTQLLCALPMTCESALLYLGLPSTVLMPDRVHQLRDAAKKFLADHFKDFTKCQKEVLKPLAGLEAVLSSDELRPVCEAEIYEFVLKWARLHYPKLEERRGILSKHILQFVRFPFMSLEPLKKVLSCVEIESEVATKIVLDALSFKAETPQRQRSLANDNPSFRQFVERPYMNKHVKVVEFELPRPKFIVYMSLKREECAQMYPSGHITSQFFHSGEHTFVLSGVCVSDATQSHHQFGLFLFVRSEVGFTVDYEGAAIMKPSEDFVRKKKGRNTFTAGKDKSFHRIFSMLWAEFMAEDSPYFINGVLHLKVELTIEELTSPR